MYQTEYNIYAEYQEAANRIWKESGETLDWRYFQDKANEAYDYWHSLYYGVQEEDY